MSKRVYINCPFKEKDEVKKAGAKFDVGEKKWYIPPNILGKIETFNRWEPNGRIYMNCPFNEKDRAKSKGAKWDKDVGNGIIFLVKRGTKILLNGYHQMMTATLATLHQNHGRESKLRSHRNMEIQKCLPRKINRVNDASDVDLRLLPRITSTMTIAQLSHELHYRDAQTNGTSNKNKEWFLQKLGLGSIWMTSTQAKMLKFNHTPNVSSRMTISQLQNELMERIPSMTRAQMTGMRKDWYLERLCPGTVWITRSD